MLFTFTRKPAIGKKGGKRGGVGPGRIGEGIDGSDLKSQVEQPGWLVQNHSPGEQNSYVWRKEQSGLEARVGEGIAARGPGCRG
jgi:hypothetical protein